MRRSARWKSAVALTASASLIAGCANEQQSGVLIGAGAGALIGQLLGGDTKATAIGAGVGALVGGLVGTAIMQQRARDLENRVNRSGGRSQVTHIGESRGKDEEPYEIIVASMTEQNGALQFLPGQDRLSAGMTRQLDPMAAFLGSHPDLNVAVIGHTDDSVPVAQRVDLSHRRADAVAMYLLSRNIAPERIVTRGAGSYAPLESNATEAGRAKNRRVDLVFYHKNEQPPEIRVDLAAVQEATTPTSQATVQTGTVQRPQQQATQPQAQPAQQEPDPVTQSPVRSARELADIYTGTDEGRTEAQAQQTQAAHANAAPPVSPIRSASDLLVEAGN